MTMKKSLLISLVAALFCLTSCFEDIEFSYYDVVGYCDVGQDGMLTFNSGTMSFFVEEDKTDGKWKQEDIILIRCDVYSQTREDGVSRIRLTDYEKVFSQGTVVLSDADPEALGGDGVCLYIDYGYEKAYKRLDFAVCYSQKYNSVSPHDINLVYDDVRSSASDTLFFYLRHNGHGDVLENEEISINDFELTSKCFAFDISTAIPESVSGERKVCLEWDWYVANGLGGVYRTKEHHEVKGKLDI